MRWLFIFFILFLLIGFSFYFWSNQPQQKAQSILNSCEKTPAPENCYAAEFTSIAEKNNLDYTLSVLNNFLKFRKNYSCHFIGHVIGMAEVMKAPDNWEKIYAQFPTSICSGGFLMGALEGVQMTHDHFVFDENSITHLCLDIEKKNKNTSALTCFHTMGHLLLVDKKGKINNALQICSKLKKDAAYECYAGVFMENEYRRNLEAMKIESKFDWNENSTNKMIDLCNSYEGQIGNACWREISHMFIDMSHDTTQKTQSLCNQAPTADEKQECQVHSVRIKALEIPQEAEM